MGPTPKYVEKQVLDLGGATGDALTTSREARWCCDFFLSWLVIALFRGGSFQ
jgi:hypothetical protein